MEAKFRRRQQGSGKPMIYLYVNDSRFKGRRFKYSTGLDIDVKDWKFSESQKKASSKKTEPKKFGFPKNAHGVEARHLRLLAGRVLEWSASYADARSGSLNPADLKKHLDNYGKEEEKQQDKKLQTESDFFKTWQRIIDETRGADGGKLAYNTRLSKNQTLNLVTRYCRERDIKPTFETLDMNFYHDFSAFMDGEKLSDNSKGKHFKEIKSIMREAQDRDIPVNAAYTKKSFKVIRRDSDNIYLTEPELKTLLALKLTNGKERVRDLFVMACYVGVRHSDWHQIRKENIVDSKFIKIKQTKTGDTIHVPVHPVVRFLLAKYNGEPPRVISNQKCNEALKEIFNLEALAKEENKEMLKKADRISTHTARRSFATNAYLSKSMSTYSIMACTGHRTEASFLKYLKLSGLDKAQDIAESKFFSDEGWSALSVA